MNHLKVYAVLPLLAVIGSLTQPCNATTIQLDFSKLAFSSSPQNEVFDIQISTPNAGTRYTLNQLPGSSNLSPSVANNFTAIEHGLTINLTGDQSYAQLDLRVDLHFTGTTAFADVTTLGAVAVPFISTSPSPALQTFMSAPNLTSDLAFGPNYTSVNLQTDHYQYTFLQTPVTPPVIKNLPPVFTAPTPVAPAASPSDPLVSAPEPGSATALALGLALVIALYHRKRSLNARA